VKPKLVIGNKNYSSWSLRPWFLMSEAGIEFDEHRIPLDTPDTVAEIAAFNAAGKVPILVTDSFRVWDSLAICETVAEQWPEKKLWPDDAADRAFARAVSAEMHSGFFHLRDCMPMNCRAMGRKVEIPDALGRGIDRVIAIWSECHKRFGANSGWLFGRFSVADAMFAPVVLRFRTYGINLPVSAGYYPQRVLESKAMQAWLTAAECEVEVIEADEKGQ